jgi:hypothetical protein
MFFSNHYIMPFYITFTRYARYSNPHKVKFLFSKYSGESEPGYNFNSGNSLKMKIEVFLILYSRYIFCFRRIEYNIKGVRTMKQSKHYYIKIFILFILGILIFVPGCSDDDATVGTGGNVDVTENQYIMGYPYTGNRNLIIDLREGPVIFEFKYEGGSYFRAELKRATGETIEVISETNSDSDEGRRQIEVDVTTSYVLHVVSNGNWNIVSL